MLLDEPDDAAEPEHVSPRPTCNAAHAFARAVREAVKGLRSAASLTENGGLRHEFLKAVGDCERAASRVSSYADQVDAELDQLDRDLEKEREERKQAKLKKAIPTTPPAAPPENPKPTEPEKP